MTWGCRLQNAGYSEIDFTPEQPTEYRDPAWQADDVSMWDGTGYYDQSQENGQYYAETGVGNNYAKGKTKGFMNLKGAVAPQKHEVNENKWVSWDQTERTLKVWDRVEGKAMKLHFGQVLRGLELREQEANGMLMARKQHATEDSRIKELDSDLERVIKERNEGRDTIATLKADLSSKNAEIVAHEQEIENLRAEVTEKGELKERMTRYKSERNALKEEKESLTRELELSRDTKACCSLAKYNYAKEQAQAAIDKAKELGVISNALQLTK